jgi:hypothetical protein
MKVFVLQNPKAGRGDAVTDFLPVDGSRTGDAPRCSVCGKPIGMLPLMPPVRVELESWGLRWGDVAFGPGDQILVSDKLTKLFADAGLVGFERLDVVEIAKAKRRKSGAGEPPGYRLASIQRSRALLDESASGLVRDEAPVCEECRIGGIIKRADRIVLQANTWSGEDVFFARGLPGTVLTSERFKHLCEANDLANCSLVAAEDFNFDHYPQERPAAVRH